MYDMALVLIRIAKTELVLATNTATTSIFLINTTASNLESAVFVVFETAAGASSITSFCICARIKIDLDECVFPLCTNYGIDRFA